MWPIFLVVATAINPRIPYLLKDVVDEFVPATVSARENLYEAAQNFTDALAAFQLNVVTAESLTAGMISSYLVDVPFTGKYIYGGHAVYDSDAKRVFLGVREPNVYTEATARQMARGAIDSSRALVGVAVTGEAGPVQYPYLERLGVVDFAISLKTTKGAAQSATSSTEFAYTDPTNSGSYATFHKRLQICGDDGHTTTRAFCEQYYDEALADAPRGFTSTSTIRNVRLAIRQETVFAALVLGAEFLNEICADGCPKLEGFLETDYDGDYLECGEPSQLINASLSKPLPTPVDPSSHCMLPSEAYSWPWNCEQTDAKSSQADAKNSRGNMRAGKFANMLGRGGSLAAKLRELVKGVRGGDATWRRPHGTRGARGTLDTIDEANQKLLPDERLPWEWTARAVDPEPRVEQPLSTKPLNSLK